MAGFGKSLKKRPFPDEDEQDEAIEGEVDEPRRPPVDASEDGAQVDGSGDENEEVVATDEDAPGDAPPAKGKRGDAPNQGAYDKFVRNGMRMIYSEQMLPQIIKSLDGNGNPPHGLANTTLMVIQRLEA